MSEKYQSMDDNIDSELGEISLKHRCKFQKSKKIIFIYVRLNVRLDVIQFSEYFVGSR